jgi:hypothetical protein
MASENDADFRVKLTDAYLKIRKVKVNPNVSVDHEIALKKGPAIYPIRRVECKKFYYPRRKPLPEKIQPFQWACAKNICLWYGRKRRVQWCLKKESVQLPTFQRVLHWNNRERRRNAI